MPRLNGLRNGFAVTDLRLLCPTGRKEIYESLLDLLHNNGALLHSPALRELLRVRHEVQWHTYIRFPGQRGNGTSAGFNQGFNTRRRRDGNVPAWRDELQ